MEQARKWPDVACRTALHSTVQHCTAACALASWSWPTPIHPSIYENPRCIARKKAKKKRRKRRNKQTNNKRSETCSIKWPIFLSYSFLFRSPYFFILPSFPTVSANLLAGRPDKQRDRPLRTFVAFFFSHLLASDKPAAKITTVLPHLSGAVVPFCFFTSFCLKA